VRTSFALLLVAHGIAHLVGFVVPWGLMAAPDLANRTTVVGGAIDIGESGMKLFGIVWLALAIGFVTTGGALLAGRPDGIWIVRLTALSLVACIAGWPDARIGLIVNVAIIAVLFTFPQLSTA